MFNHHSLLQLGKSVYQYIIYNIMNKYFKKMYIYLFNEIMEIPFPNEADSCTL